MTVGELYREVSQLGFETSLDSGEIRFYQALNRCLLQVSKVKPVVKRINIAHYIPKNILPDFYCNKVYENEGEDIVFEADGALSFYFEASGTVNYKFEKKGVTGDWMQIGSVGVANGSKEYKAYCGKIDGVAKTDTVRIVFYGDYFFTIRNVALFAQKLGADEFAGNAEYTEYDLAAMFSDFNGIAKEPTDGNGNSLSDYKIEMNSILCVPNSYSGTVTVEYEHLPNAVAYREIPEKDETEVDADKEICSILPYLVASYVWMDDEPAKAQYYKVMYEERAQEIKNRVAVQTPIKINNHGW